MYQTQIASVSGSQITDVYGKSLINIGNSNFGVGDYAWTDGKCIYGNEQAAGSTAVFNNTFGDIPILRTDYSEMAAYISFISNDLSIKDAIKIGTLSNYSDKIYFINNKDHAYLINSTGVIDVISGKNVNANVTKSNFIDGCVDDDGSPVLLTVGSQEVISTMHYDPWPDYYYTSILGPITNSYVYKNGEKIDEIDLSSYLKSMHTGADMSGQMGAGGRVNKDGSYRLTVQADVEHYNISSGETVEHNNDDINGVGKWTDSSTLSKIRLDLGNDLSQIESSVYLNSKIVANTGIAYGCKAYPPACAVNFSDGILYSYVNTDYQFRMLSYITNSNKTSLCTCGNARLCEFSDINTLKKALNSLNI